MDTIAQLKEAGDIARLIAYQQRMMEDAALFAVLAARTSDADAHQWAELGNRAMARADAAQVAIQDLKLDRGQQ